jgi:hypothetical protein
MALCARFAKKISLCSPCEPISEHEAMDLESPVPTGRVETPDELQYSTLSLALHPTGAKLTLPIIMFPQPLTTPLF